MLVTVGNGDPDRGARLFLRVHALAPHTTRELAVGDLGGIDSLALSADGARLALACSIITRSTSGGNYVAPIVRVLDLKDGRVIDEVRSSAGNASTVRFDSAARIVYQLDNRVFIRDIVTGRTESFKGSRPALSGDGSVLALYPAERDGVAGDTAGIAAQLHDVAGKRQLATLPHPGASHESLRNFVNQLAFRPDDKQIAVGFADGKGAAWDSASRLYMRLWPGARWARAT